MDAKKQRIIFMGTPDFAVAPLKRLVESGYNIAAVVTNPDKPAGRGLKMQESAVKKYAVEAGLKILQPVKLKDPGFISELRDIDPDMGIVIAFRMLPEAVWSLPRLGTFNLHASLLPQYRGAAPINWAIINGETKTGVTTFMLNHEIDKGDIISRREVDILDYDTAGSLHDKLMHTGTELVVETVEKVISADYQPLAQPGNDKDLLPAPKIFKEDCLVRWDKEPGQIYNLIRGLSPYPTAWAYMTPKVPVCVEKSLNEEGELLENNYRPETTLPESLQVKIYAAHIAPPASVNEGSYGTISSDGKTFIKVSCKDGGIFIDELQLPGKKRMKTVEFLRGFKNIERYSF